MEVYRYIDFCRLKEIVEKKQLYFVNPFVKWSDIKEGTLYRLAQDTRNLENIDKILSTYPFKNQIIKQLKNGGLFESTDGVLDWFGMRCQSWSKSKNSLEMWNAYSYDNQAVCISVHTSKLLSLHYNNQKVEGFSVSYKKKINISEELQHAIGKRGEFYFPFILQSKEKEQFEFENEYRLYILMLNKQGEFNGKNHEGVYIDIDCEIEKFINSVSVHPNASNDFVDCVKQYVADYNIKFSR